MDGCIDDALQTAVPSELASHLKLASSCCGCPITGWSSVLGPCRAAPPAWRCTARRVRQGTSQEWRTARLV